MMSLPRGPWLESLRKILKMAIPTNSSIFTVYCIIIIIIIILSFVPATISYPVKLYSIQGLKLLCY